MKASIPSAILYVVAWIAAAILLIPAVAAYVAWLLRQLEQVEL
jgi:hypothetical protein